MTEALFQETGETMLAKLKLVTLALEEAKQVLTPAQIFVEMAMSIEENIQVIEMMETLPQEMAAVQPAL
jgi:hypothetical protein